MPEILRRNDGRVVVAEYELARLQKIEQESRERPTPPPPSPRKRIVVVDNVRSVYDPTSLKRGRTNYDDIYDSLKSDQRFMFVRIQAYEGWSDFNTVLGVNPDVILIHASAFYSQTSATDEEKHLRGFLSYVADHLASCRVVVYSRAISTEAGETAYVAKVIGDVPALAGRLHALSIPSGRTVAGGTMSSFQSAGNIGRLLAKVERAMAK